MISIVTINLNNKEGLERTIKSVLAQTCIDDIQYIGHVALLEYHYFVYIAR